MRFDPQSNFLPREDMPAGTPLPPGGSPPPLRLSAIMAGLAGLGGATAVWVVLATSVGGPRPATASSDSTVVHDPLVAVAEPAGVEEPAPGATDGPAEAATDAAEVAAVEPAAIDARRGAEAVAAGRSAMARGRHDEAVTLLEEACRLLPDSADAHYRLGLAYVRTGDLPAARTELTTLRELDASLANLLGNLVR